MVNCIVCSKESKYKCPRCKTPYCSLPHYKSHNLFCTQAFYKSQVEQEMNNIKVSENDKRKMKEILKNAQQNEVPELVKQRFEQILESIENGEDIMFAKWVNKWVMQQGQKPFWQIQDGMSAYYLTQIQNQQQEQNKTHQNKSEELDQDEELIFYRRQFKQIIDSLPPISSLCSKPNSCIIYHIYGLVYVGCIIFRYFDNDIPSCAAQSQSLLLNLYPLLSIPIFQSIADVHYFLNTRNNVTLIKPWIFISKMDVGKIFKNKYLVLQMLLRLNQIIRSKKTNKKIDFYCSFVKDNDENVKKIARQIQQNILTQQIKEQGKEYTQIYKDLLVFK